MEIHTNVADAAHGKSDSSVHSGLGGRFGAGHDVQIVYEYTLGLGSRLLIAVPPCQEDPLRIAALAGVLGLLGCPVPIPITYSSRPATKLGTRRERTSTPGRRIYLLGA